MCFCNTMRNLNVCGPVIFGRIIECICECTFMDRNSLTIVICFGCAQMGGKRQMLLPGHNKGGEKE